MPARRRSRKRECAACSTPFRAVVYPSGQVESYCHPCRRERLNQYQRVRDKTRTCSFCGEVYTVARSTWYNARSSGRPAFCSQACSGASRSRYKPNPRGLDYCRAPIKGGCPRLSRGATEGQSTGTLCEAHAKRLYRGAPITTPVDESLSKAVLDGLGAP